MQRKGLKLLNLFGGESNYESYLWQIIKNAEYILVEVTIVYYIFDGIKDSHQPNNRYLKLIHLADHLLICYRLLVPSLTP